MASVPRGLLLLFEGFPPTVVRSQVVALAAWLGAERIVRLDVLSVACSGTIYRHGLDQLARVREALSRHDPGATVTLLRGLRPALPGAGLWNRRLLGRYLSRRASRYELLHARTDYAASLAAPVAARHGLPLVWDCRGDAVAEYELRSRDVKMPRLLLDHRTRATAAQGERAARACRHAIFVSRALRERWRESLAGSPHVIPTLADERTFFFDPELRRRARLEHGYASDQPVFVYSGTLSAYQGFEATVAYFRAALETMPDARLLVLTPQVEQASRALHAVSPERVSVRRATYGEMNAHLNAADFAFLLRPPSPVNRAAFPTKFAEYGLAGLRVIMTDATPDCLHHVCAAGNGLGPDSGVALVLPGDDARAAVSRYYRESLTLTSFRGEYEAIYRGGAPGAPHDLPCGGSVEGGR